MRAPSVRESAGAAEDGGRALIADVIACIGSMDSFGGHGSLMTFSARTGSQIPKAPEELSGGTAALGADSHADVRAG
jgi:hypothetical protein